MSKCANGMVVGLLLGAAVGMMVVPQLDRKTQKNMRRAGRRFIDVAEDKYDSMIGMVR